MKKKIAVFANGWNEENLFGYTEGLKGAFPEETTDIFIFLSYASYGFSFDERLSESISYDIPDLSNFDAAIVFGPGLNFPEVIDHIFKLVDEAGIPAVSVGIKRPGYFYVGIDNYAGMRVLADHLLEKHNVKKIKMIAGSAENDESNERIRAVRESMEDHGLNLAEEDIFYSNWETMYTSKSVKEMYGNGEPLPDAFVCANDLLAMYADIALEEIGITTPDDVIITGFDYLNEGKLFYPSVASVDQQYGLMGQKSAELLLKAMEGEEVPNETILKCRFIPGESCGCKNHRDDESLRHALVRHLPVQKEHRSDSDGRLYALEHAMAQAMDFHSLKSNLKELFYNSEGEEKGTFYILMDTNIANVANDDFDFPPYKFADEMDVVVGKKDGVSVKVKTIERREIIPGYTGEGKNEVYVASALHYGKYSFGYVVMGLICNKDVDFIYYKYKSRVNRTIDSYKLNLQLSQLNSKLAHLMEQDALTKVRNRTAFDKYSGMISEDIKNGTAPSFAILFADINDLKKINDEGGHEKGDEYIKNCCTLICDTYKHSPVFRVGGDEFVIVACGEDFINYQILLASMNEKMKKLRNASQPTKRVSMAVGYAEYSKGTDADFGDIVKRADENMYINKAIMKKGNVR